MAHIVENLVLETCAAAVASSATVPLQGTLPGFRTFASKCANGDTVPYLIRAVDNVGRPTGQWECGRGTILLITGSYYLQRDVITGSSNADAAVTFSAGTKYVSIAVAAPNSEQMRADWQTSLGLDLTGMVALFANGTPPAGWMKANGALVSRVTYARLFARIGTTYGVGDGSSTFALPDGRGEFLRAFDDGRGVDSGRTLGSAQSGQNLAHTHGVNDPGHAHTVGGSMQLYGQWTAISAVLTAIGEQGTGAAVTGISIQSSGGAENRPRNLALAAFIKY